MDWGYLFEIGLTGIASGGLYALAGLAFVMVWSTRPRAWSTWPSARC